MSHYVCYSRTCVQRHHVWMTNESTSSYQRFWDLITEILLQGWTRDTVVWFCCPKLCEHQYTCQSLVGGLYIVNSRGPLVRLDQRKSSILPHVENKERTHNQDVNSFSRVLSSPRLITEERYYVTRTLLWQVIKEWEGVGQWTPSLKEPWQIKSSTRTYPQCWSSSRDMERTGSELKPTVQYQPHLHSVYLTITRHLSVSVCRVCTPRLKSPNIVI